MSIDRTQRAVFAQLADVLIPAANQMPSASQSDVAGQWLDRVLAACPERTQPLRQMLDRVRDREPAQVVAQWRATDTAAFELLAEIAAAAYFMNPVVQQAIGYSGQGPRSLDPRPDYMEDGLLESVIRRGPIYRPTPAE
jgi:hypothetical protein